LPAVAAVLERERLLGGNWKDPAGGRALFQSGVGVPAVARSRRISTSSLLGLAATEKTELKRPGLDRRHQARPRSDGGYWLLDVLRARANPG